jgi:hypothetical protein
MDNHLTFVIAALQSPDQAGHRPGCYGTTSTESDSSYADARGDAPPTSRP